MAKEYARTQRVSDHLQRELAALIQHEIRDPRVGMVSITGVDVSRDLGYAKVYYTSMGSDSREDASESTDVLNKAAGFFAQPFVEGQQYAQAAAAAVLL
jgi:ribosome-binding factor A